MVEIIIGFLILALFLGVALSIGQMVVGLVIYAIIGFFMLVSWPFVWAYDKIKGNR